MTGAQKKILPLDEAVTHLLEECRMVLPGIQALFGFQLIAVFNPRFAEQLTKTEQIVHYIAIGLVAIAVGLVMAPAAVHRQNGRGDVSDDFLVIASRLLLLSMLPLMFGICLDFYDRSLNSPQFRVECDFCSGASRSVFDAVVYSATEHFSAKISAREIITATQRRNAMTADEVQAAFTKWLHPAALVQAAQGPEPN